MRRAIYRYTVRVQRAQLSIVYEIERATYK